MFSLEKRRFRGNLSVCTNTGMGAVKKTKARLFSVLPSEKTRGNDHKLKHGRFPLNIRKHFFLR